MNRRNFLKSLGAVCGAAVVIPTALLKAKSVAGIDCDKPVKWTSVCSKCYGKHGQHCVCNSCVDDMMVDCLPSLPKHTKGHEELMKKFRVALKDTKFKPPVSESTKCRIVRFGTGKRSKLIFVYER